MNERKNPPTAAGSTPWTDELSADATPAAPAATAASEQKAARVHLASRSPRRRELLAQVGIAFDLIAFRNPPREDPEIDETPFPGEAADAYVVRVARAKAAHGQRIVGWRKLTAQPVLAADTTLEFAGEIIGKPDDAEHARQILHSLSGQTHRVLTAVAVADAGRIECVLSVSEVRFARLDADTIARYVASGEAFDKAGAYGIQGRAGAFAAHLAGSYTGVMGLPLYETTQLLRSFGLKV
ncbi:Maf family protein [Rhodocyclus tenuis]|uniref:dTTP/UTP pyrophosphatase n=1 Tax=Rhodocyclus tenuis TaxID=1066 RepID=A0A840FXV5_RHOTE|nr:Maf family protein [Rhodocyclus tenuis]MBB4246644.1 septum formation protein [Rhodocyclus tenuis]